MADTRTSEEISLGSQLTLSPTLWRGLVVRLDDNKTRGARSQGQLETP